MPARRRAVGLAIALLLEGLLLLALLRLGVDRIEPPAKDTAVLTLEPNTAARERAADPEVEKAPAQAVDERAPAKAPPAEPSAPDVPAQPSEPKQPQPPAFIELSREQLAATDIRSAPVRAAPPASANAQVMGPPAPSRSADTPLVDGTGPNGERLYAASWYREPYDQELRGYLSAAQGPGWGLIACRTVPDFRVRDCVGVAEHPAGSNINRAVLAAAWQFRVRPPRIGGQLKIGEWVRIRIDYRQQR